jgi:photosynthetic reaction center cytochrome c subunit
MSLVIYALVAIGALLSLAMFGTAGWDLPPVDSQQTGYRGTAMEQIIDREDAAMLRVLNAMPEVPYEADPSGDRAGDIYENVQVLGHLSDDQFNRFMLVMTEWVSPDDGTEGQGCGYCHNVENMAEDNLYTKIVTRRMIQQTWHINDKWKDHVGDTGVTCYTCHRGKNVPEYLWFTDPGPNRAGGFADTESGQNIASDYNGATSLPYDALSSFLLNARNARVHGNSALPNGTNDSTIQDTEWTYAFMVHMSESLGVNCTYCHNSRAFNEWDESPPQRVTAWHGIQMARELNVKYLEPLGDVYPSERLGPTGDAPKVSCATCHQGVNKPLYGAPMLKDYLDELSGEGRDSAPDAQVSFQSPSG